MMMMMFTARQAVRIATTANTVPIVRARCGPVAGSLCHFSSIVGGGRSSTSSIDYGQQQQRLHNNSIVNNTDSSSSSSFFSAVASTTTTTTTRITTPPTPTTSNNLEVIIQTLNRNARRAKKANKGSRPCSRDGRRKRKEKIGRRKR